MVKLSYRLDNESNFCATKAQTINVIVLQLSLTNNSESVDGESFRNNDSIRYYIEGELIRGHVKCTVF